MTQIIEVQYFPTITWFVSSAEYMHVIIEQYERFQKMSFRNRCVILGSNGCINLTVPVVDGRENKKPTREVRIDYSRDWAMQHWRSITSSYSRAPYFEYYGEPVKDLLFSKQTFLFDLNLEIINWLTATLKLDLQVELSEVFEKNYNPDLVKDLRNRWTPKNYNHEQPNQGITYIQVFEHKFGFVPNLSILDLLFCKGSF